MNHYLGGKMKVFIVYCHPSQDSFTYEARCKFIEGLKAAGHSYIISDLYQMNFDSEFTEEDYKREAYYLKDLPVKEEILIEQRKINDSDAIVFIYPVFWTDAPAKLIGWIDKVWTYGFAYGEDRKMKLLDKALCIAITGKSLDDLVSSGQAAAMENVMLGDRINYRAKEKRIVFLDGMSRGYESRNTNWDKHLEYVYSLGLFM
ncbi:MAG: flavodoxin family protein [Anaerocolumna sp.]|jgi:NAD(P)H dehydrogenase (quinone)|nr:flavodoxin family protein [Anaerocolumna sp.]